MLNGKRLTIVSDSVVQVDDEKEIKAATFGAILDIDTMKLSFTSRHIDEEACKKYRDHVRKDQADFEDYAYDLQDRLMK